MKKVEIYTLSECTYCHRAKELLEREQITYKECVIDDVKDEKIAELKAKTGSKTVPQIFVEGQYIGGCDDLYSLHQEGKFAEIFK